MAPLTSLARCQMIAVLGPPSLDHLKLSIVFLDGEGHAHHPVARLDDGQYSTHLLLFLLSRDSSSDCLHQIWLEMFHRCRK